MNRLVLMAFLLLSSAQTPAVQAEDKIEGLWKLPQDNTLIEIKLNSGILEGRVYQRPGGRIDEKDRHNANPELRNRSVLGLRILWGLKKGRDRWSGGHVYDPDSGNTYQATAELIDQDQIRFRGYIGIPLFGKTQILNRYVPAESKIARLQTGRLDLLPNE